MVWLPWKPGGDEEAGLKLATASTRPGAWAASAGAVVGWRDAPGQGGERRGTPATEDQCGRWRSAAARGAIAHVRTAQRGQSLLPAQSGQGRLGQARALFGPRACPARDRTRARLQREYSRVSIWRQSCGSGSAATR